MGRWITLGHWTNFAHWNRAVGRVIREAGVHVLGSSEGNAGGLTGVCVWRCRSDNEVIIVNDRIDMMSEEGDDALR